MIKNKSILIALLMVLVFAGTSFAATVWVNSTTTGCGPAGGTSFNTIQIAIGYLAQAPGAANATTGANYTTIVVCKNGSGGHFENVLVNLTNMNNLSIVGNESSSTATGTVSGGVSIRAFDSTLPIFNITGSNVVLANFTFVGNAGTANSVGAILAGNLTLSSVENVTIENSTFLNLSTAITVIANSTVIRNNIFGTDAGGRKLGNVSAAIRLGGSDALSNSVQMSIIRNNSFIGNSTGYGSGDVRSIGILVRNGSFLINITNNTIQNYTFGIRVDASDTSSTVAGRLNLITGNPATSGYGQNIIYNNTYGVWINRTLTGAIVRDNHIFNNTYGLVFENASFSQIISNNFTGAATSLTGIYVSGMNNNLTGNNITNYTAAGICISNSPAVFDVTAQSLALMNITITGGNIRSLAGSAPYGIDAACSASGRPLGVASGTTGINIFSVNITGNLSGYSSVPSSRGISVDASYAVNISFVNVSGFYLGYYSNFGSIGGSSLLDDNRSYYLVNVRFFNNTFGIYDDSTTAYLLANLDINDSQFFNNSEAGILISNQPAGQNATTIYNLTAYNNKFGVYLNATTNATISSSRFLNQTMAANGFGVYLDKTNLSRVVNNTFNANDVTGLYLSESVNNAVSDNNFTNSSVAINFVNSTTTVFANNNITNVSRFGILMNTSTLTFSGDNALFLNWSVSAQRDLGIQNSNFSTYASTVQYNITSQNLIFAMNFTYNVSVKVANLTENNIDTNVSTVGVPTFNGTVLGPLNDNAGRRQFLFALNITTLGTNAVASPVFYFNVTTAYLDLVGAPTLNIVSSTTGQNWTPRNAFLDFPTTNALALERYSITSGYFAPATYVIASPASSTPVDSSTNNVNKKSLDMSYKFVCPDNSLQVSGSVDGASASSVTYKLYETSPTFKLLDTKSADGSVSFTLPETGDYQVDGSGSGYVTTTLALSVSACKAGDTGVVKEGTTPPVVENNPETQPQPEDQPPVMAPEITKEQALADISAADEGISAASKAGKDVSAAKSKLDEANKALNKGDYGQAVAFAAEAQQLAQNALPLAVSPAPTGTPTKAPTKETPVAKGFDFGSLVVPAIIIIIVVAGIYFLTRKGGDKGYKKGFKS